MQEKINNLLQEIEQFVPYDKQKLEEFRIKLLGRQGTISELFEEFKKVEPSSKKEVGRLLNELKNKAQQKIEDLKIILYRESEEQPPGTDLTLPGEPVQTGSKHPLSIVRDEIISIFSRIGFTVTEGPEIEDDWHNFSALNFPENHPARDMQDTFFIDSSISLRTHTSSIQIRVMETTKPPIRVILPGRVFRNETISARAHCQFHQIEALYINENVSFTDLKQTLLYIAKEMFGEQTQIRLRPSYFPFTEPSAEMDISCPFCKGKGCNICKGSTWVEIMGCGMVDPNVLENCGIDSNKYSGFALGMGIERITMLKYNINDLRLFFENDIRFLNQFKAVV